MDPEKVNYYEACDKAIKAMNRENVETFGQLKLAKWDEVNVIQVVTNVYRKSAKRARKRYYEVAYESYILGLMLCGVDAKKAHKMAPRAITLEWLDSVMEETDLVTFYRFYSEAERKAYKLAETLEVAPNRNREIDKALKYWSQQLGQFAISITDAAIMQAFTDMDVEMVQWISERDSRTCNECIAYSDQIFRRDEVPAKPHWGCRCKLRPVFRSAVADEVATAAAEKILDGNAV